jgi:hypothetical protein
MDWWFQSYNLSRVLIARSRWDLLEVGYELLDYKLHFDENLHRITNYYKEFIRNEYICT